MKSYPVEYKGKEIDNIRKELKSWKEVGLKSYNDCAGMVFPTLVCVDSHKSGGRAKISLTIHTWSVNGFKNGSHLVSKKFLDYRLGTYLIVDLVGLPLRRMIKAVSLTGHSDRKGSMDAYNQSYLNDYSLEKFRKLEQLLGAAYESHYIGGKNPMKAIEKPAPKVKPTKGEFWVSRDHQNVLLAAHELSKKRPVKVLLVGGSGYGKTSIAKAISEQFDLTYHRENIAQVTEGTEFFGYHKATKGSTHFIESPFAKIVQSGNAVIVLDEINRIESSLKNILFPLLDHEGKTTIQGKQITCGPNVIFVMTANIGYMYTGTFEMDAAFRNRVDITLHVGPLKPEVETRILQGNHNISENAANQIVATIGRLRYEQTKNDIEVDVSTRVSLRIAEFYALDCLPLIDIFRHTILSNVNPEEIKPFEDTISNDLLSFKDDKNEKDNKEKPENFLTEEEAELWFNDVLSGKTSLKAGLK